MWRMRGLASVLGILVALPTSLPATTLDAGFSTTNIGVSIEDASKTVNGWTAQAYGSSNNAATVSLHGGYAWFSAGLWPGPYGGGGNAGCSLISPPLPAGTFHCIWGFTIDDVSLDRVTIKVTKDNQGYVDTRAGYLVTSETLTYQLPVAGYQFEFDISATSFSHYGGGCSGFVQDLWIVPVPEPSTVAQLLCLGAAAIAWRWHRRTPRRGRRAMTGENQ
jgi:hypothetical protein